jgi:hypothetical protein
LLLFALLVWVPPTRHCYKKVISTLVALSITPPRL